VKAKDRSLDHVLWAGRKTMLTLKRIWKNLQSIGINPVLSAKSVGLFYIRIQKPVIGAHIWFKYKTISAHAIYM